MRTTPEEREEIREHANGGRELYAPIVVRLLDDIDELIKSNAILSMFGCGMAGVCADATHHQEAKAFIDAEVARLRAALDEIVALADCYNGPCVEIARKALEGGK